LGWFVCERDAVPLTDVSSTAVFFEITAWVLLAGSAFWSIGELEYPVCRITSEVMLSPLQRMSVHMLNGKIR
jgi:hypothetical protein